MRRVVPVLAFLMGLTALAGPGGSGGNPSVLFKNDIFDYSMRVYVDFIVDDTNKQDVIVTDGKPGGSRIEVSAVATAVRDLAHLASVVDVAGCVQITAPAQSWGGFDCGLRRVLLNPGKFYYEVTRTSDDSAAAVVNTIQPKPLRRIYVGSVEAHSFDLPNGQLAELPSSDLKVLFGEAIASQAPFFAPTNSPMPNACGRWIELGAQVSTFVFALPSFDLTFGYDPSGVIPVSSILQASGPVDVIMEALRADFDIKECASIGCETVGAAGGQGSSVGFQMNFNTVLTGMGLLGEPSVERSIRQAMEEGVRKMVASDLSLLDWSAKVNAVSADQRSLTFDAGAADFIARGQGFAVYAAASDGNPCNIYHAVALIRVTEVGPHASQAAVEQWLDSRGILPGDAVTIRPKQEQRKRSS